MKETGSKSFETRNIYSHRRCIRLNLDLEEYEEITTNQLDGFNYKLLKLLPELEDHQCRLGEKYGFVKVLEEGTYLNHICGHIAIALQNKVGIDVSFCSESKNCRKNCYTVYEFKYKNTATEAGRIAVEIINSLLKNESIVFEDKLNELKASLAEEQQSIGKQSSLQKKNEQQVPIIAITGTNGKTTTTRLIAHVITQAGLRVGMTTTDGIYINGECVYEGDTTGPKSALMVLNNKEVDAAVLETARGGMIRGGLAYDLADIAVITNICDDHLGIDEIETLEDLAKVKALVGEAVKPEGYVVVNGDNEMSLSIINRLKSKLIVFSEDKDNEVLLKAIKDGGYGIYLEKDMVFAKSEASTIPIISVKDISITLKGRLRHNVQNAMAACGALIGFGVEPSIINLGLESFQCDEELNPGRFNVFDINGVTAILDYGHNIDGYKSVLEGLSEMEHNNLIGVIGVPGDRLDRTTLEIGKISGAYFDRIFIKEDKDRRGRYPGEIAKLLKEGVLASNFSSENLEIVLDERTALERALDSAKPGDIVIVFFEDYQPLLQLVKSRINSEARELAVI